MEHNFNQSAPVKKLEKTNSLQNLKQNQNLFLSL